MLLFTIPLLTFYYSGHDDDGMLSFVPNGHINVSYAKIVMVLCYVALNPLGEESSCVRDPCGADTACVVRKKDIH
jgi:hypothetical protein